MKHSFREERKKTNLKFQSEKVHAALYELHNNQAMVFLNLNLI